MRNKQIENEVDRVRCPDVRILDGEVLLGAETSLPWMMIFRMKERIGEGRRELTGESLIKF